HESTAPPAPEQLLLRRLARPRSRSRPAWDSGLRAALPERLRVWHGRRLGVEAVPRVRVLLRPLRARQVVPLPGPCWSRARETHGRDAAATGKNATPVLLTPTLQRVPNIRTDDLYAEDGYRRARPQEEADASHPGPPVRAVPP